MSATVGDTPVPQFVVESYDNFDSPNERCCTHEGVFDTVEEALTCARSIVEKSLIAVRQPNQSPVDWYKVYALSGDGVYAHGTGFNPYTYAQERIQAITGDSVEGPWTQSHG